ncbi:trypsin, alkaline A-like [Bicyclus anynana]|uniref:Trypsin, alkaline A-like n=2 Tax=Bicyclus anynana TaxID=110368 RepID=A0ABM3LKE4_BICAN|nr:trypsin, alkaline A-like [Bicyclus anynana]
MRLLVFLVLVGAACAAKPQQNGRIIGGTLASIYTYPFMANMNWQWGGNFHPGGGGTLITPTAVVSVPSFIGASPRAEDQGIRLGTTELTGGTLLLVSQVIVHSGFDNRRREHDILIMRLRTAAPLSNRIRPARIAGANYALPDNQRVYIAGWGIYNPGVGIPRSQQLRHVDVRVVNHALCTQRYADLRTQPGFENMRQVFPGNLCTGLLDIGGQDFCTWDYGGPVVHQGDILVGAISWNYLCGHPFYPGVSTDIRAYANWIVQNS